MKMKILESPSDSAVESRDFNHISLVGIRRAYGLHSYLAMNSKTQNSLP